MLSLAEELLLLALDDEKGKEIAASLDYGLSGAMLLELALKGRLQIDADEVSISDPSSTGNPLLDKIATKIAQSKRKRSAQHWITNLNMAIKERVLTGLVEKGILRREEKRFLRVFKVQRYPLADAAVEREVRDRLRAVVLTDATPAPRDVMLISLISACSLERSLLSRDERKGAAKRIAEIVAGDRIGNATATATAAVAVSAATMAAITVAISSSCSSTCSTPCCS